MAKKGEKREAAYDEGRDGERRRRLVAGVAAECGAVCQNDTLLNRSQRHPVA